jgi:predicted chitinase
LADDEDDAMKLDKKVLTGLGVSGARADKFLPALNELLPEYGIDTPLRVSHFLAQVLHESGRMRTTEENLNYSEKGLLRVFSRYFSGTEAREFARRPERIANRVYANRIGNGDEASGDGFRFRGRGLMQLTGRSNYRKFSTWLGSDVVTDPDPVADRHAVASAVFFWDTRNLNALADLDDGRKITKRVNGGFHGLPDRLGLLVQAKTLLDADALPVVPDRFTHRVTANRLNLRSRPRVSPQTLVTALNQGTLVSKLADADVAGWLQVQAVVNGRVVEGFVHGDFIKPLAAEAAPAEVVALVTPEIARTTSLPPAHLRENRRDITRARGGGRAFPLGETGRPRRGATRPDTKARQLLDIAGYLDSPNPAHHRYEPQGSRTFCNIYAYDFCYLSGVYLPRVWWKPAARRALRAGGEVAVEYGRTVRELRANDLHDWLEDYGSEFGWHAATDLDELQAAANQGQVGLIVAKRHDDGKPGHITVVAPEHDGFSAARSPAGLVQRPVESQAGRVNFRFKVNSSRWWLHSRFESFAFWVHR